MLPPEAVCTVAAAFIAAMVWLRTRMQYPKGVRGRRALTAAGAMYFATLGLLLVSGWFAAPALARRLTSPVPVTPTLARVVWFLVTYYLFIPLHRVLRGRGVAVFRSPEREMA